MREPRKCVRKSIKFTKKKKLKDFAMLPNKLFQDMYALLVVLVQEINALNFHN
ncbi:hypothetical protein BAE44_0007968, partial [Dichanthelium oligosanthes]